MSRLEVKEVRKQLLQQKLEEKLELELGQNLEQMKTFVRAEIAKVKAPGIPDCPVCFEKFLPPKRIVQCLTAGGVYPIRYDIILV